MFKGEGELEAGAAPAHVRTWAKWGCEGRRVVLVCRSIGVFHGAPALLGRLSGPVGGAIQGGVVHQGDDVVGAGSEVDFFAVKFGMPGRFQGGAGVLRGLGGKPPMGDRSHRREIRIGGPGAVRQGRRQDPGRGKESRDAPYSTSSFKRAWRLLPPQGNRWISTPFWRTSLKHRAGKLLAAANRASDPVARAVKAGGLFSLQYKPVLMLTRN